MISSSLILWYKIFNLDFNSFDSAEPITRTERYLEVKSSSKQNSKKLLLNFLTTHIITVQDIIGNLNDLKWK